MKWRHTFGIYKYYWYCRWCGESYQPRKEVERDGFCCSAHKQAWFRAHKKWKNAKQRKRYAKQNDRNPAGDSDRGSVTQAKTKKKSIPALPTPVKRKTPRRSRAKKVG